VRPLHAARGLAGARALRVPGSGGPSRAPARAGRAGAAASAL